MMIYKLYHCMLHMNISTAQHTFFKKSCAETKKTVVQGVQKSRASGGVPTSHAGTLKTRLIFVTDAASYRRRRHFKLCKHCKKGQNFLFLTLVQKREHFPNRQVLTI